MNEEYKYYKVINSNDIFTPGSIIAVPEFDTSIWYELSKHNQLGNPNLRHIDPYIHPITKEKYYAWFGEGRILHTKKEEIPNPFINVNAINSPEFFINNKRRAK